MRALIHHSAKSSEDLSAPGAALDGWGEHFDEGQVVELTGAIAWENYRARFNHALEIGAQGFSEGAVCMLPPRTAAPAADREDGREQAHEREALEAKP